MNKFLVTFNDGTTKTVEAGTFTAYANGTNGAALVTTFFNQSAGPTDEWGNLGQIISNIAAFVDVRSVEKVEVE